MENEYWQEAHVLDDEDDELTRPDKKGQTKQRKRKWREIEAIKEQRRLRKDIANFEQYSY
ncbi:DUF3545 family protein [Colwellia sp. 12G3]|uniref:DUF3545 family protein n=1 Tax=Colwellia sp. 12G3 TaxID=2058299 RepID=UPI000C32A6D1|nr:DUF3545 family protein [Colwellia sp. 12G3]PKI14817.1 hypothetical protein CXF71_13740 [Colwellia sp. 12G3]